MDINALAAEGQTRAAAWLGGALGGEAKPAEPVVVQPKSPEAKPEVPVVETKPAVVTKPGLVDAIRKDRETRTAGVEASKYKAELDALRKENDNLKALGALNDPFEFLKSRQMSKEDQAAWGQAFLYDLKPEIAPQEFRLELYKMEQARKETEKTKAEEQARAQHEQQAKIAQLDAYADSLHQHVSNNPGSSPESELWFTEEADDGTAKVNTVVYTKSLIATANNLAARAQATGQQVDLSPANVAKVLEDEVSKRLKRRDAKLAGSAKVEQKHETPVIPASSGKQAADTTTMSANGLGGGPPLPPAQTEAERKARAAAVLFGTK